MQEVKKILKLDRHLIIITWGIVAIFGITNLIVLRMLSSSRNAQIDEFRATNLNQQQRQKSADSETEKPAIKLSDAVNKLSLLEARLSAMSAASVQTDHHLSDLNNVMLEMVEGISKINKEGQFTEVSAQYAAPMGYKPEELIGRNWTVTVYREDIAKVQETYEQMVKTGAASTTARGVKKNGSTFKKFVKLVAVYDSNKQFVGNLCFMIPLE